MALTKSITTDQGFEVPAAYAAIIDFTAIKQTAEDGTKTFKVETHVNVFKDATKAICLYGANLQVTVEYGDGAVFLADIYTQIKTLTEWSEWLDA